MRRGSCILAASFMGVLALLCSPAPAQSYSQQRSRAQVDVSIFYDSLAPHGDWLEMPDYGWSWAPRVERGWRPYTRGQWVMTDDGWFWDSDEQFGWAAYHYGRWVNDRYYGWIWVPGTEWAPAWVSWRHGNGYTGWAPLPPRATWRTRVGLSIGGHDIDAFIGARDYSFVQDRAFVDRGVHQRLLPPAQNVTIINVTNNVTNYTVVNDRVVNGGIGVAQVERAVGRRVPRARTVDVDRADVPRRAMADEVAVFRPEVRAAPERRPAQGRSLVKGDEPPPQLAGRRREREQEQRQKGSEPELTAKDVEQRRPGKHPGNKERNTAVQPEAPRPDAAVQQQEAQRQRGQQGLDADKQRANDQEQQRLDREKRQAHDQQQRDQQQLDGQRAKREQAEAARRAKDAEQKQPAQRRRDREQDAASHPQTPRADAGTEQQEAQRQREQARQDADKQRAKDLDQQRLDRQERRGKDQEQRDQQQVERQRAKRDPDPPAKTDERAKDPPPEAKDNRKDKGKKNPKASPTPPPGEKQ